MPKRTRPSVSVIVPFSGDTAASALMRWNVSELALADGDEVLVVDNSPDPVALDRSGLAVVRADAQRSSYYARNIGGEHAGNSWLLFLDADCRPPPDLLDRLFDPMPTEGCGILAGEIAGEPGQTSLAARWTRSRRGLRAAQEEPLGPYAAGATGNMLVRRSTFEELGGFQEGVRSSADVELCWRAQDSGWTLASRPGALVFHRDPGAVAELARQALRYGAGRRWLARRNPTARARRAVPAIGRSLLVLAAYIVRGRADEARFKLLDLLWSASFWTGYAALSNRAETLAPEEPARQSTVALSLVDGLGAAELRELETLSEGSRPLVLEAAARPARREPLLGRGVETWMLEDDAPLERLRALAWLLARHPLRLARVAREARLAGAAPSTLAPALRRVLRREPARVVPLSSTDDGIAQLVSR